MGVKVGFEGLRGGFHIRFLHESIVFGTQNLILGLKMFFTRAILSWGGGRSRENYGGLVRLDGI